MIRTLVYTPAFLRDAQRIGKRSASAFAAVEESLTRLGNDANDPRLGTHKLRGGLSGSWACSARYDLRIVFEFVDQGGVEAILLTACGTHDEVY